MSTTTATENPPSPEGQRASKIKPPKKKAANRPSAKRGRTKQDRVLALLKDGTTIPAIMRATGWQQHSVRGFLAGVVRKKLRLNLTSKKAETGRAYRIGAGKTTKPSKAATRKAR